MVITMRALLFLSLIGFTSSAYADINQNPVPAATPSLQFVNNAISQINNNEPMMRPQAIEAPTPFPNQQARFQQSEQIQVPDVTLPYPLPPDPVVPAPQTQQVDQ